MTSMVMVRFEREAGEFELDPGREYRVSVDGGPFSAFHSPWKQERLEELVASLRNVAEAKPDLDTLRQIGRELGEAIYKIKGLAPLLVDGATVCWQLDYPELARIPWELATIDQRPYHHLLLRGVSFVRRIPAAVSDQPAEWPTGRDETLRLLYAWSERKGAEVPHQAHLEELQRICSDYGVELVDQQVSDVDALAKLCSTKGRFHFVHLLAHGAMVGGEWGLRLENGIAKGEQVARALVAGGGTPALVTVSACDSANEPNNSFGSVAYELHVYGIPLVLASQFRLRKEVSTASVAHVYEELLGGGDPLGILAALRRQLAPRDNEAWANEVVYSRYRPESLEELAVVARQQAALRRARSIAKRTMEKGEAIAALKGEEEKLLALVGSLQKDVRRNRAALAETFGLLGSLARRIADRRSAPADPEDLRRAMSYYQSGFQADANSHYCGVNVVHLALRVGEKAKAEEFIPRVRFAAANDAATGADFWAHATLGDLEVYAGRADQAAESYRAFVSKVTEKIRDVGARIDTLNASRRPLLEMESVFPRAGFPELCRAAESALAVLASAIAREEAISRN